MKEGYQQDQPVAAATDFDASFSNDLDTSVESTNEISSSDETSNADESEEETQTAGPTPPTVIT